MKRAIRTARVGAAILAAGTAFGPTTESLAAPDPARQEECRQKLVKAAQAGVIHDLGVKPSGVQMVVDSGTWRSVDFSVKTEMVRTVVCLIVEGDSSKSARVEVRDNLTNRVIGRYDGRTLEVLDAR